MRLHREGQTRPLPFEELPFRLGAALGGVVLESAGLRDHSMARNHNHGRVPRAGGPDRAVGGESRDVAFDLAGGHCDGEILHFLRTIPAGETMTYGEIDRNVPQV